MQKLNPYISLVGRILIAVLFVVAGIGKITSYDGTLGYMQSMGVPGMLLPVVILLELGGGILIILGWQTRITAFALAGFCILSALIFHNNFADQMQSILFMKNLGLAGGFAFLVANGAGQLSIDARKLAQRK